MVTIGTVLAALFIVAPPGFGQLVELGYGGAERAASPGFDHARAARLPARFDIEIVGGVARVSVTSTLSGLPAALVAAGPGERPGRHLGLIATRSERVQLIGVVLTALVIGVVGIWRLATRQ